jgi:hypothetical protein
MPLRWLDVGCHVPQRVSDMNSVATRVSASARYDTAAETQLCCPGMRLRGLGNLTIAAVDGPSRGFTLSSLSLIRTSPDCIIEY